MQVQAYQSALSKDVPAERLYGRRCCKYRNYRDRFASSSVSISTNVKTFRRNVFTVGAGGDLRKWHGEWRNWKHC
ncbi:MAG: hypothetical protein KME54_19510 [Tolypothrix brevis GSE-NOS-MK-07-07A]|nr:hypothetical protein [Tolypothrix brevis GSE-NOS-MK-07-07A]